jgi:hypothetical protein
LKTNVSNQIVLLIKHSHNLHLFVKVRVFAGLNFERKRWKKTFTNKKSKERGPVPATKHRGFSDPSPRFSFSPRKEKEENRSLMRPSSELLLLLPGYPKMADKCLMMPAAVELDR